MLVTSYPYLLSESVPLVKAGIVAWLRTSVERMIGGDAGEILDIKVPCRTATKFVASG